MSDTLVTWADFDGTTWRGFTAQQMNSTVSYKVNDLKGIILSYNDLRGWNFAGQNLTEANFSRATLAGADLRAAWCFDPPLTAATRNTIWPDGEIKGLDLTEGDALVIQDFDLVITVTSQFTVADGGALELLINDADWGLTVGVTADVSPQLSGTFQLGFSPEANRFGVEGKTFDPFDWPGPLATENRFSVVVSPPGILWDLSQLYTSGEVTLTAVPEPSSLSLAALAIFCMFGYGRRR